MGILHLSARGCEQHTHLQAFTATGKGSILQEAAVTFPEVARAPSLRWQGPRSSHVRRGGEQTAGAELGQGGISEQQNGLTPWGNQPRPLGSLALPDQQARVWARLYGQCHAVGG